MASLQAEALKLLHWERERERIKQKTERKETAIVG